jgi:tRNA threonylcarbamoyladenosine biosynthesis protein TsaE
MVLYGKEKMEEEAARFVRSCVPRTDGATVVTLSGELGAGKTAFVKGAAKEFGITEHVTSPTFVIMKIYSLRGQKFKRLVHIDAYRLKGEHHLKVLGWDELSSNPENIIFLEWPEQASGAIPINAIKITLRYTGDDEREIQYESTEAVGTA